VELSIAGSGTFAETAKRVVASEHLSVASVVHEDVDAAELFSAGNNGGLDAFRVVTSS
jgi:hypothetical protein